MTKEVYLLDYGAGNVRSVINSIQKLGFDVKFISSKSDFALAEKIIFPGVGAFRSAMDKLNQLGFVEPLKAYIKENRPFMGICVGMQCLYDKSTENGETKGLEIIPAVIQKFKSTTKSVPHIGWNSACKVTMIEPRFTSQDDKYYFVHSYACTTAGQESGEHMEEWANTLTTYGDETFVSSISRGNIFATQFHPEKSGLSGLRLLERFLKSDPIVNLDLRKQIDVTYPPDLLTRRIIACLDVRSNDDGDLVVTKGDQYDVREKGEGGQVRNLGKPVQLAERYFLEGADEITFLNITSFRDCPLEDTPMLAVLKATSETVFVPLTIGGGIRDITQPDGTVVKAIDVAGEYFRSGADKVSIGSDAVYIAEKYCKGESVAGNAITAISTVYGAQAVVISVDPKRVYVADPKDTFHNTTKTLKLGPKGEEYCWYQCTVKGGRETRDLDVVELTKSCQALGAGEILLNCMDNDGMNQGYDLELVKMVKTAVKIPVIASSGAGKPEHFDQVFVETGVEAALAAGIFHRNEVSIAQVKQYLASKNHIVRIKMIPTQKKNLSADISVMLEDLLNTENKLLNPEKVTKSVSFGTISTEKIEQNNSSVSEISGILKAPSSTVVPCEVPLKPMDFEMMEDLESVGSSESDSSDISDDDEYQFPSDEEEGHEEDFEADELEPETSAYFFEDGQVNDTASVFEQVTLDDYQNQNYDGLLETLDHYIKTKSSNSSMKSHEKNLPACPTSAPPILPQGDVRGAQVQENYGTATIIQSPARKISVPLPNNNTADGYISSDDDKPIMKVKRAPNPEIQLPPAVLNTTEMIMSKLSEANIRKITTRIYIETSKQYKTTTITSLMTAMQVVNDLTSTLEESPSWTLFEICTDLGIERPMRDWEIVTDVLSAWGATSPNAILIKKYGYRATLSTRYLRGTYPRIQGFMYLQLRPGKWQKRFCYLKEYCLYYLKDKKNPDTETLLVNLSTFDVYTMMKASKKNPTEYCLAIRSDMSATYFMEKTDYIHYCCVEKQERLVDWVLALRLAKSERMIDLVSNKGSPAAAASPQVASSSASSHLPSSPLVDISSPQLTPGSLLEASSPERKHRRKKSSSSKGESRSRTKSDSERKRKDPNRRRKPKPLIDLDG